MIRFDVTTNDWVIFAPSRSRRPHDFRPEGSWSGELSGQKHDDKCPFCNGNESATSQEVYAVREHGRADGPGWKVRVIPNKFPALRIEESERRIDDGKLFHRMGGCGAHEVIIDSPDHSRPLAEQPPEQILLLLRTMQERYNDLMRDTRFQTIVIFKNHGQAAGTSLAHPHCQLIATPVAPRMVRHQLSIALQHFDQTGGCLYSELLAEELAFGRRILVENDHYVAFLPYASHVPFEIWIMPRLRQSSFRWVDPANLPPLAWLLKAVLLKLHTGLGNPAFNFTINTAPRGDEDAGCFLWHIQILPRITTPAGFELGSGMAINTVLPEDAAEFLRGV